MRTLFAVLLLLVAMPGAVAKCLVPIIAVSGKVTNGAGAPVPGAVVAVAWLRRNQPQGPAQAHTDDHGTFRVHFRFDTYTKGGFLRGDFCRESIPHVSVSAYSPGYRSEPVLVPVTDWAAETSLVLDPYSD